jgi:hypothetical protein
VYSDSISASNIPTLNFAKDAKLRMGHPPHFRVGTLLYRCGACWTLKMMDVAMDRFLGRFSSSAASNTSQDKR